MVVLDTSVVYKWFTTTEEKRDEAKAFLIRHLDASEPIWVPDLFLYEIVNAWTTKSVLTKDEVNENIVLLQTYALTLIPSSYSLVMKASQLAKTFAISVYDAMYIALAEENECHIITADEKLLKKVSFSFVKGL